MRGSAYPIGSSNEWDLGTRRDINELVLGKFSQSKSNTELIFERESHNLL